MTNLSVTEDEFKSMFRGREDIWELLTTKPKTEHELLYKYLPSKLWRLNNIYTFIDKYGERRTFTMNRAQFTVYAQIFNHFRLIILKSRQQGISTLWLISFFDDAIFNSHLHCGLMAQDKDATGPLLERIKFTWDNLDPIFKNFLDRKPIVDNASEFRFNNESRILVRTSFRSATLQRLHISELGKIANKHPIKAKETKTGTLQTLAPGNLGIIESTAEGANMFKNMWDASIAVQKSGIFASKDFMPVFLSWLFDPDCVEFIDQEETEQHRQYFERVQNETGLVLTKAQKNFWIAQERELEGDIYQEYPATAAEAFAAAKDGTYWARRYIEQVLNRGHKVSGLYDTNLPVYCVLDLGRNDYNVLTYFQFWHESNGSYSIRIIDEYYNTGEWLGFYALELKNSGYEVEEVALPHDAVVTDLSSEEGKSREEILHDEGITNTVVLGKSSRESGIQAVRAEMPYIWIDEKCVYIDQCILNYTKKWDELLNNWKTEPVRNEYAHGADTVRYLVQYVEEYLKVSHSDDTSEDNLGL